MPIAWLGTAVVLTVTITMWLFMWPGDMGLSKKECSSLRRDAAVHAITQATPNALLKPVIVTDISTIDAVTFDPHTREAGTFRYRLSKPGLVHVQAVLRDDPSLVLRVLADWQWRNGGGHVEAWDGRDESGNIVDSSRCLLQIVAIDPGPRPGPARSPVRLALAGAVTSTALPVLLDSVEPLGGGAVPLDVRFYLDYELVLSRQLRAGSLPVRLAIDTSDCGPGEHLLHVNVRSQDQLGVAGLAFTVANDGGRLARVGVVRGLRGSGPWLSAADAKGR